MQDGSRIDELESSGKLRETFEKLGWKEIKARQLFIPGAKVDPYSHPRYQSLFGTEVLWSRFHTDATLSKCFPMSFPVSRKLLAL